MGELKTKPTDANVIDFIAEVPEDVKRNDSYALLDLFTEVTGENPQMWGTNIIGFGTYHYKSERSSQEGDWPLVGFSPRKQNLTLYITLGSVGVEGELAKLGKHKTSKGCLYIKKLADVDKNVLKKIIKVSYEQAKKELT